MIIYDNKGTVLLDIDVDDTSMRYKAIKGENSLTLKFSLAEHIEVPLGSFCEFKGETYILMLPEDLTMNHRSAFEYTLVMHSEDAKAKRYMFVNPVDGRLRFPLTAKPKEHLQMFVDNMNMRDSGWEVGECVDHVEVVLSYNHNYCMDALVQLADKLDLDYWFEGKTVNLGKLEKNKNNPLSLSYGGDGIGLKANIKRQNYNDALPIEVLYVQGSSENIDPSKYKVDDKPVSELHLPLDYTIGYDGVHFDDEDGYDSSKARLYKTDSHGLSVRRADKDVVNHSEDSLDCSDITATREEKVEGVWHVDREKHFFDIAFYSDVDYSLYQIGGENPTIIFQKGMLAGKEFDIATDKSGKILFRDEQGMWRMEIVPQEIDGITMPDVESGFVPVEGDTFKFFGIQLPEQYLSEAEMEMLRYAVKHIYVNEDVQYTISGELDEIYAKRNWDSIRDKISLGSYISFSDKSFQDEPLLIRITGIKEYVNKPYSPMLEISNAAVQGSLIGSITRLENDKVKEEQMFKEAISYSKRRFSSAQETLTMLQSAFNNFSEGINPVTVQTMAMLIGDESLQFKFTSPAGTLPTKPSISYDSAAKTLKIARSYRIWHMTIGIDSVTSPGGRSNDDYLKWTMPTWNSGVLDDASKSYYLYARVAIDDTTGDYVLSESAISMESEQDYYHLLVGVLNREYDGTREFVPLYGFTEVLPGQITTDIIRSADGNAVLDLVNGLLTFGRLVGLSGQTAADGNNLRIWAGKGDSDKEEAPFRVYDDGSVYASLMTLLNGCTIGNAIRIEDGKMVIDLPDNNAKVTISEDGIMAEGYCKATIGHCGGAGVQGFANGVDLVCPNVDGGVGVHGEASNGGYAFWSTSGKFGGMRPNTRVITQSGDVTSRTFLTEVDFSVMVYLSSGVCYLRLPLAPQDGQEYHVESHGSTLNIIASQPTWMSKTKSVASANTAFTHDGSGILRLKFYKQINQWQCSVM